MKRELKILLVMVMVVLLGGASVHASEPSGTQELLDRISGLEEELSSIKSLLEGLISPGDSCYGEVQDLGKGLQVRGIRMRSWPPLNPSINAIKVSGSVHNRSENKHSLLFLEAILYDAGGRPFDSFPIILTDLSNNQSKDFEFVLEGVRVGDVQRLCFTL